MTKEDIENAVRQGEQENALFADKSALDGFMPQAIPVGRAEKAGELAKAIAGGLKKGYAPPFVFVYGRTCSGKSTVVKFVCDNLTVSHRLVNLRRARSAFGCASLILEELGVESVKSPHGIGIAVERMAEAMEAQAKEGLFALVLDEFDVLAQDRRASDFIYKLLTAQQKLREKGCTVCVVAISNRVTAAEDLDDRVRSRIAGAPEVFFDAYAKDEIIAILKERAQKAFAAPVNAQLIEYCAELSSAEHGDARRAIDLLRAAAETAGASGECAIAKSHIDMAVGRLEREKVELALSRVSYHARVACAGLARIAFLAPEQEWYSTSILYRQYCLCLQKDVRPLGYRRVAELLEEMENLGLAVSRVASRGRRGYGREYKLVAPPDLVGRMCFPAYWEVLLEEKERQLGLIAEYESQAGDEDLPEEARKSWRESAEHAKEWWRKFVGGAESN